ncbi:type II secretion system protein GspL [Diaphorobacter caeni]|uniref:type II secretion system protein GspL n=1 Tax=Diaphorobacter caeni TaxID=2784387 RepID=UPI00189007A5|nr:type II secretion system protein GspL [Diaphorobacter caeni]MBF5003921.1 general secretion pathway protein GspL [Diaphorobacter caeni]
MSTLILYLPPGTPGPNTEFSYTLTADGHSATRQASAKAARLPDPGRTGEVVAVVPARGLSWQRVTLPQGATASAARLRSVLEGLLEEQLLDEPAQLHFALAPDAQIGEPAWVAVCDRVWLRETLQLLESVGRSVGRIVPEFAPGASDAREVYAIGVPEEAQLVLTSASADQAVNVLPLNSATLALGMQSTDPDQPARVRAEPAVAGMTEKLLGRSVELSTSSQRSLVAARGQWNLAQLEFSSSGRTRALRSVSGGFNAFLRAPQWRAARWALAIAVVAQIVGLNVAAYKERQSLAAKEVGIRSTLQQAFPNVKVVVDAPVQMEREVAQLRQAAGSLSHRDFEPLLAAAGAALPVSQVPSMVEFADSELHLTGVSLTNDELSTVTQRLQADGFVARAQGSQLWIRAAGERP